MKASYRTVVLSVTLAGCVAAASASEPSATLSQFQGRVFVGQASAIKPASEGMRLFSGDRVVAVAGGSAEVAYAGGCTVAMPESSILAIESADQCRAGRASIRTTAGFQKKAIGQSLNQPVLRLVDEFDTLCPVPLNNAYNALTAAQQAQLHGVLTDAQLTNLHLAITIESGRPAAQAFLALLTTAQADAVVAASTAAGAVGGGGLTIGTLTLTAAEVGAVVNLATVATVATLAAIVPVGSDDDQAASR